jgi:hypothetical protein
MMKNISGFLFHFHFTRDVFWSDYTKMVWADTFTVGCGYTGFFGSDGNYWKYRLCLYGPGGNIVASNSSVYKIGPACSACPASAHSCEDGLCV